MEDLYVVMNYHEEVKEYLRCHDISKSLERVENIVLRANIESICTVVTIEKLENTWYWKILFPSLNNSVTYISLDGKTEKHILYTPNAGYIVFIFN